MDMNPSVCEVCNRVFASKYSCDRHKSLKHKFLKRESDENKSDVETEGMEDDEVDEEEEDNDDKEESEEESDDTEDEEDEGVDAWEILIVETIRDLKDKGQKLHSTDDIIESPERLNKFMLLLQKKHIAWETWNISACDDPLFNKIQEKEEKIENDFDDQELSKTEIKEMAWNKLKVLIKKKILENLEEFDILIKSSDDEDSDMSE